MKKIISVVLLLLAVVLPSVAFARDASPQVAKAGAPDVAAALTEWKSAVEGGDVNAIIALYDKNAIMISTFAQKPMTKREEIVAYFKKVVANPDVRIEIEETHPRKFGGKDGEFAVNSGSYTLSYTQEGEEVALPARFSFVYQLQGGKWVIVEQHSSRVPTAETVETK